MAEAMPVRQVDADVWTTLGRVRAVRSSWAEPIDRVGTPDQHWLELSLLPRSRVAQGCFPDHWGPRRFERIGAMFFLPARRAVHALSECHVQSSIVCTLNPQGIGKWLDDDMEWTDGRLQGSLDLANPSIRRLVFAVGEEICTPGFASETLVELMITQIAIGLGRHFRGISEDHRSGGLAPWRLRLIDERLAAGDKGPSLSELAALCGLSIRQLARAFRVSRGCSVGDYLAGYRVEQAKRMLARDYSMKVIANATGFGSPSNFSVAFHRVTGESPRDFRQRIGRSSAQKGMS